MVPYATNNHRLTSTLTSTVYFLKNGLLKKEVYSSWQEPVSKHHPLHWIMQHYSLFDTSKHAPL